MRKYSIKAEVFLNTFVLIAAATPAWAQDSGDQSGVNAADSDRISIEILKEGMLKRPGDPEWTFTRMRPSEVFFPGDSGKFSANNGPGLDGRSIYEKMADYPRDVPAVERWYLSQIPQEFDQVQRDDGETVGVLYLPGCDEPAKSPVERVLPGEAAIDGDFTDAQWLRARVEAAMTQADIDPHLAAADVSSVTPDQLLQLNRRLLVDNLSREGGDDHEPQPAPIVFKRYCAQPSSPPRFPGLVEPAPPPPPAPPSPMYEPPHYFFIDLPSGMASAKVARGVEVRRCPQRNLTLPACIAATYDEASAIPYVANGKHLFAGKINERWVGGSFQVDYSQTERGPPLPPPPGRSYQETGVPVIHLVLDAGG